MKDLENVKIETDLQSLSRRVERITNYADAASAQPQARNVLNAKADAEVYASLLFSAQLRLHELLGRHAKQVVQPPDEPDRWTLLLQLPAHTAYPLLVKQLTTAVEDCLAADIAAHWLTVVRSDRAEEALALWRNAQQQLKNLSLWRTHAPRITPVFL